MSRERHKAKDPRELVTIGDIIAELSDEDHRVIAHIGSLEIDGRRPFAYKSPFYRQWHLPKDVASEMEAYGLSLEGIGTSVVPDWHEYIRKIKESQRR